MTVDRLSRPALILCAAFLGVATVPAPALADGPGYGGGADALTVRWQPVDQGSGLAVYAVGFRGGSSVSVRVGAESERSVSADESGAVDVLVGRAAAAPAATTAAGPVSPGTSVLVAGHTPAGELRTLVGAVPPRSAGIGATDLVPWAGALAVLGGATVWFRRRFSAAGTAQMQRYRHAARHRA